MISEVTPRGKEFLFFSLFSIMGKTSSFIGKPFQQCNKIWAKISGRTDFGIPRVAGPFISSAIIDRSPTGNNSLPFYFLFGLTAFSFGLLAIFVDLKKSRVQQEVFLEREKQIAEDREARYAQ